VSDEPPEVRWSDRSEQPFQEVAEVLGTTTDLVMGVHHGLPNGRSYALYTPDYEKGDRTVWVAVLQRNHVTHVMELVSTTARPGFLEELGAPVQGRAPPG
jgi:hypothetical protein